MRVHPCWIHSEQVCEPPVPEGCHRILSLGRREGGSWFSSSLQPLVALFFPSEEGRIVASRLAEGWRAAWARGSPWVAWSRPRQGQTLIPHQMGDSLISLSSLKGSFSPKIGIFYREIKKKNPGALICNSLGYQFGSWQEPSLFIDLE